MEQVSAQETTEEVVKQKISENIGGDERTEVPEGDKNVDNKKHESLCKEAQGRPSELFEDFSDDEFMDRLDVVDSWADEDVRDQKNNGERSVNSPKNGENKVSSGVLEINSTSGQDSQVINSSGKKDDKSILRGKSAEKDSSNCDKDDQSRENVEGQHGTRSLERKDAGGTSRERSSEKRDGSPTRREGSLGRKERDKSLERRCSDLSKEIASRSEKSRLQEKSSEGRVHSERSGESRNDSSRSRDKRENGCKNDRVVHREKSYEKISSGGRPDDRSKRKRSPDRNNSNRSTYRDSLTQSDSRKGDRNDRQASDKNMNKQESNLDQGNKQAVDNTSENRNKGTGKVRDGLKVSAVTEISCPKQSPSATPHEPIPPGTEDFYLFAKTIPDAKSDITVSRIVRLLDDDLISVRKERDSKNTDHNASRSVSVKRGRSPSNSGSTDRIKRSLLERDLERNSASDRDVKRTRRSWSRDVKIDSSRGRSRERREHHPVSSTRKKSSSRERYGSGKDGRKLRHDSLSPISSPALSPKKRSLSRERYGSGKDSRRLQHGSLSPISSPASSARKRSLSRERYGSRKDSRKLRHDSLSPISSPVSSARKRSLSRERYGSGKDSRRFRHGSLSPASSPVPSARKRALSRERYGNGKDSRKLRHGSLSRISSPAPSARRRSLSRERYKSGKDGRRLRHGSLSRISSPVPSARKRALSREGHRSGRRSRRLRRGSLSPISISDDSSILLSSDSEYERSRHRRCDRPRKRKSPFLKELADILAGDSHKTPFYQTPQPTFPGGQQNAPHVEMVPTTGIHAPNLNDGRVLPSNYPPHAFQPGGPAPAEGYPRAYPGHLPANSMPMQPCPPTDGLPPTDFTFTLHSHIPGIPLPVPAPVPGAGCPPHSFFAPSTTPIAPPPPSLSEMAHPGKRKSLSSVLEASLKVGKQQIGVNSEAIIQRCEKAIQTLEANEQLLMGSCFTFSTVLRSSGLDSNPAHADRFPILSENNVSFGLTCPPKPEKPKSTKKAGMLKEMLSLIGDKGPTTPVPPSPAKCERCLEQSKKTFADSSMQTKEVVLCSVATQSDYQPCSDTDLRVLNQLPNVFQPDSRVILSGDKDDRSLFISLRREELPLENKPFAFASTVKPVPDKSFRDVHLGGHVPVSHPPAMIHVPFKKFLPKSQRNPALSSHVPGNSSVHKPITRVDFPTMSKPVLLNPQASDFRSRFSSSDSLPSTPKPLKGILKNSRQPRPEESLPVLKSRDEWSRLEKSSTSRYSPIPDGMTPEEYQRFYKK